MPEQLADLLRLTADESRLDRQIADLVLRYSAEGRYEVTAFVPTEAALAQLRVEIATLTEAVGALPPTIASGHFHDLLSGLGCALVDDQQHPGRYLAALVRFITGQVWEEIRTYRRRCRTLTDRLSTIDGLFGTVEGLARRGGPVPAGEAAEAATSLQRTLAAAAPVVNAWTAEPAAPALAQRMRGLASAAAALAERLRGIMAPTGAPLELLPYEETLRRRHGVELAELLNWHEAEIARCAEHFAAIGRSIDASTDPCVLLAERSPAYPTAAAMFAAAGEYLPIARERSLGYITLPDGEVCRVSPMPELQQSSYPWGGAYGPSVARGLLWGKWYCNQANFRAVTRGWIQMMAVHECYPGHHAHRVKAVASDLPQTFKLGRLAGTTPLSEGIAHRAETQFVDIFDDPVYPLFVAYRRLHTAVRIKADLLLHYHCEPRERVIELYERFLQFDRVSATGQVHYQELHPGYMTCYYYGCRQLEQWHRELPLGDAQFTETTFSLGWVHLRTVHAVLERLANGP